MYRMYPNRSLSLSYFRVILFGGRGASIGERLLLIRFYFFGGLLFELKPLGLVLEKGLLLEGVRYISWEDEVSWGVRMSLSTLTVP